MTTDKPEPMSAEEALEFMDSLASHVDEREEPYSRHCCDAAAGHDSEARIAALIRSLDERARAAEAERDAARKDASFIAYWQGQTHEQRERAIKAEAQVAEQAKEIAQFKMLESARRRVR